MPVSPPLRGARPARVLVLTCGVLAVGDAPPSDAAAHGGAWGFARVLRLEQPALRTQSADVCRPGGVSMVGCPALTAPTAEAEVLWCAAGRCAARLRAWLVESARLLRCGPNGDTQPSS